MVTQALVLWIPAKGEPIKLVHKIESLDIWTPFPAAKHQYAASGRNCLSRSKRCCREPSRYVAMQYSPNNLVFTVSLVDGGTLEMIRGLGKNVVSSGDLVAQFEATFSEERIKSHFAARDSIDAIVAEAFQEIGRRVRNGGANEYAMQQWMLEAFGRENLVTLDPPIFAVNANSGNPHYDLRAETSSPIREGDSVLLDVWGKKNTPGAVYYDITWMAFVGKALAPDRMQEIFTIVRDARDVGVNDGAGCSVSRAQSSGLGSRQSYARPHRQSGYGQYFVHRTGHSIGTEVHANGANMDDLEIHDERQILPNSCFSIEPGIYLPEFGVRSEVNMLIRAKAAEVTGKIQREIVTI